MWLIEFTEGHLKGLTLPIDSKLLLTGEENTDDSQTVCLSEYLSSNTKIELNIIEDKVLLKEGNKKTIKLKNNFIYSVRGLNFFVFRNGDRNPKVKYFLLKKYGLMGGILFFSILLFLITIFFVHFKIQEKNISEYLSEAGNGYIKDGKIYLFDQNTKQQLPKSLRRNSEVIKNDAYQKIEHLNIDIVSNENNRKLNFHVIEKEDYSEIRIDIPEKEMEIMRLFGKNGIAFDLKDGEWVVNDVVKAQNLIKASAYRTELSKIKSNFSNEEVIDAKEFPYSVFISLQSGKYIYDQTIRYWEGSYVPNLGILDSISSDKIIFIKENKRKVYFVNK